MLHRRGPYKKKSVAKGGKHSPHKHTHAHTCTQCLNAIAYDAIRHLLSPGDGDARSCCVGKSIDCAFRDRGESGESPLMHSRPTIHSTQLTYLPALPDPSSSAGCWWTWPLLPWCCCSAGCFYRWTDLSYGTCLSPRESEIKFPPFSSLWRDPFSTTLLTHTITLCLDVARCSNSAPIVSALVGCCFVNKERQQTDAYASNRWRFHHPENVRALRHVGRAAKQQTRARTTFDCTHTHSRTTLHRAGKTKDSHSHTRTAPSKRRTFRVTALHTHTHTPNDRRLCLQRNGAGLFRQPAGIQYTQLGAPDPNFPPRHLALALRDGGKKQTALPKKTHTHTEVWCD